MLEGVCGAPVGNAVGSEVGLGVGNAVGMADGIDVATAAAIGSPNAQGVEQLFNMTPQDFVRQLPGVHAHNYRKLINSVPNLRELSTKTKEELAPILGAQNAKLLHDFLHRKT